MPYDAAQFIANLPSTMRGTLTTAADESATVARASISSEVMAMTYGEDDQYTFSLYVNSADFTTPPTKHTTITYEGASYLVLAVNVMPGTLRRLDLGGVYGR